MSKLMFKYINQLMPHMLHELCSLFGVVVNVEVIQDRQRNTSTGKMEVTMRTDTDAAMVKENLNYTQVFNKMMKAEHVQRTL